MTKLFFKAAFLYNLYNAQMFNAFFKHGWLFDINPKIKKKTGLYIFNDVLFKKSLEQQKVGVSIIYRKPVMFEHKPKVFGMVQKKKPFFLSI